MTRRWGEKKNLDSEDDAAIIAGIVCKICGCPDTRTRNTVRNSNGTVTRYKVCRNCRLVTTTTERVNDE